MSTQPRRRLSRSLLPRVVRPACFSVIPVVISCAIGGGCASPGEPVERKAPVPQAVADLAAAQSGSDVILTFTVPKQGVNRLALKETPSLEIYRGLEGAPPHSQASPEPAQPASNLTLLATIPSAMVSRYAQHGQVRYTESLEPSDFRTLANQKVEYAVRAYVVAAKASTTSNLATVQLVAPAMPVEDLSGEVTHAGVSLKWTAPTADMSGAPATIRSYRLYRREIRAETQAKATAGSAESAGETPQFTRIAELDPGTTSYLDSSVSPGATYAYSIRSTLGHAGQTVESGDSDLVTIVDEDTFPPAAPQNLVVASTPAQGEIPAHIELSWQISPEPDVAGYNVYRSEDAASLGERQNTEVLLTPAFRDMKVIPGRRYFYRVTAVDRSGNESAPSAAVSADVPTQESKP